MSRISKPRIEWAETKDILKQLKIGTRCRVSGENCYAVHEKSVTFLHSSGWQPGIYKVSLH